MNIENITVIFDYLYDQEINHFEEEHDVELPVNLQEAITWCEVNGKTDHVAYNLLILKQDLLNTNL